MQAWRSNTVSDVTKNPSALQHSNDPPCFDAAALCAKQLPQRTSRYNCCQQPEPIRLQSIEAAITRNARFKQRVMRVRSSYFARPATFLWQMP